METIHPPSSILHLRRILVRGVNWLGDAVMTTPALLRLRERFPDAHIALLTPEKLRDVWLHHPAIDEIITLGASEGIWRVASRIRLGCRNEEVRQLKELAVEFPKSLFTGEFSSLEDWCRDRERTIRLRKSSKFDIALVLPNSPRSAMEVWLAKIPQRVGYARPWRSWFFTQAIATRPGHARMRKRSVSEIQKLVAAPNPSTAGVSPVPFSAHQIHEYLHLTAALGANPEPLPPLLVVTDAEVSAVRQRFGISLEDEARPWFGLNPGAEYGPAKRWPRERFIEAAIELQRRTNCRWLIFGGRADAPLAAEIESAIGHRQSAILNLAGQTSLRELCAAFKLCRVLLTNDSGPMHVAAALGTPVVVPFGSTSPELTGPGLPGDSFHRLMKSNAPCAPCFRRTCPIDFRCMNGISVESVVNAVLAAKAA